VRKEKNALMLLSPERLVHLGIKLRRKGGLRGSEGERKCTGTSSGGKNGVSVAGERSGGASQHKITTRDRAA